MRVIFNTLSVVGLRVVASGGDFAWWLEVAMVAAQWRLCNVCDGGGCLRI